MDLKKFKTLALVAVAAGLATQPVSATGSKTIAEDNYYVRSCGGEHSCGGGYPKPYTQTNPAPVALDEDNTSGGKTTTPPGQASDPAKNGVQPPAPQKGSTTSRYYQKRDRDVADNNPNFSPSNGLLPDQQKSGSNKLKTTTGTSSTTSTSPTGTTSTSPNSSSNINSSGR